MMCSTARPGGDRIYGLAGNDILSQCSLATTYQKGASLNEVLTHETGQSRGQAWGAYRHRFQAR